MSEAGKVVFVEVPPGEYTVRVEKPGFQTATSSFNMPEDDHTVNVTLVPAQQPPTQPPPQQPPQPVPAQPVPTVSSPLLKIAAIAAVAILGFLILSSLRRDEEEEKEY